ncbi:DUF853 family protein [Erysipelothrix sp. strain 2 (EsS2-7-Brazil)]|uniref:helicase HerA-like domain-containing protein n=1 Tax=Erysipelothrix sp. strain 2 (EsS2-7-Brazil) TaxID=2500579 RepID=UPI00190B80BC|nr:helicase HerA-like domain-containing protein [Erysipelothrix sp. strain 2 (EsS2-7-Brazil)]MBK2404158.1 DUF853 family protein [Erysipelothrix sp. strain 2 (EsS2-7-Brazil)]
MLKENKIWIAQGETPVYILPQMLNRHGLITGATGTGKTVTLKVLTEALSDLGVPTFLADIKGDVSGLASAGIENPNVSSRVEKFGVDGFEYKGFPVTFWDIYGKGGIPVRTTISEMGPIMLSKLMDLNETQASVLSLVFKIADAQGLLLLDIKDLKAMLDYVYQNNKELTAEYGLMSTQTIGAVVRKVVFLEEQGADIFFGEPALDIQDWICTDSNGRGMVNILHSVELFRQPTLYATFLLWMLSELFETLPEVGDVEKPKMVFFFDEAHLLFKDVPKALVDRIELVVKLIRSKGVGVYFISQSPSDIPDRVLSQLGNRIQHALRAYTPGEQKQVRAAAQSFRANPNFNTETAIMELGTGEAIISTLDEKGTPQIAERAFVLPPQSLMAEIDASLRTSMIQSSSFNQKYIESIDRFSAYESLAEKMTQAGIEEEQDKMNLELEKERLALEKEKQKLEKEKEKLQNRKKTTTRHRQTPIEKGMNRTMSTIGNELGKAITRNIMGILTGKK